MDASNQNCVIGELEAPVTQDSVKVYCEFIERFHKDKIISGSYPRPMVDGFGIHPARWNAMVKNVMSKN